MHQVSYIRANIEFIIYSECLLDLETWKTLWKYRETPTNLEESWKSHGFFRKVSENFETA